jgi:nucleotide-binding universal stress UspA family protein
MKTIVLGYDDSEPAKRALERTAELVGAFGANVDVTNRRSEQAQSVDQVVSRIDDGAAQLAMDVEAVVDECDIVARRVAQLRADVARQRVLLDGLSRTRP